MKRAAQGLLALLVIVANRPASMHAAVRKGLDLVFGDADNQKGKLGNIIDECIADFLDVVLVAGHLPHALPQPLDFAVMLFLGPVAADLDGGHTWFHGRFFEIHGRRRDLVAFQQFGIGNAVGPIMSG